MKEYDETFHTERIILWNKIRECDECEDDIDVIFKQQWEKRERGLNFGLCRGWLDCYLNSKSVRRQKWLLTYSGGKRYFQNVFLLAFMVKKTISQ